jgi:cytidylate kinase
MSIAKIIAIDGPAASGKTTLGKALADELGYLFFDTGIMYRVITWAAISKGIEIENEAAITRLAETADIDVRTASQADGRSSDVLIDGQDVTWEIRRSEVEAHVSAVSAYPGVRTALSAQQRKIGMRGQVVMVGRDIGTVVLPEAELKIYLDASAEERARRRYQELIDRGEPANYKQILAGVRKRDRIDSTRAVAPLRPASDAIILNSDGLDAGQVLELVLNLVRGDLETRQA